MSYTGDEDADMQHFYKLLEKEINLMKQNVSFAKLEWKYQQDLFKAKFRELQQDKARWNIGRKLEQQEKMKFQFQQQLKVLQMMLALMVAIEGTEELFGGTREKTGA